MPRGRELAEDLEGKQALPLDPTAVAECEGGTLMHGASTCLFGLGFSSSNWGGNTSHIPEQASQVTLLPVQVVEMALTNTGSHGTSAEPKQSLVFLQWRRNKLYQD